jgi:hypothetical protein
MAGVSAPPGHKKGLIFAAKSPIWPIRIARPMREAPAGAPLPNPLSLPIDAAKL